MRIVAALVAVVSVVACSSSSTGGAGSGDGGAGGGGAACSGPSATFVLNVSAQGSFCDSEGCNGTFITLLRADGTALAATPDCETSCGDCAPVACPALCRAPNEVGAGGLKTTWNGTYSESSTCGSGVTCAQPECAEAGHYVARMCVFRDAHEAGAVGGCQAGEKVCTDVPFDWPTTATITGTIM
ncbi:MAG TPA: hypothetical protein VIF62_34460 [Labilithrix sp.]